MGSSASKATRAVASQASTSSRKFPTSSPLNRTEFPRPTQPANNPTPSPSPASPNQPGPQVYPRPSASTERNEAINLDASDPVYAQHLRQLGPVAPNPFQSNSSTHPGGSPTAPSTPTQGPAPAGSSTTMNPSISSSSSSSRKPPSSSTARSPIQHHQQYSPSNPALVILQARQALAGEAEREMEQATSSRGFAGRRFLDVQLVQQILRERAEGKEPQEIERRHRLAPGTMARLGVRGVVELV